MSSPTVEVSGRAGVEIEPEFVVVVAEIEAGGETATGAQRRVDDRLTELDRELPAGFGDVERHVTGRSVGASDQVFDSGVDGAFVASASLELRCGDHSASDVTTAVAAAGGSVDRTEPRLTESQRADLREELLTAATENAREQATHIARAEGYTVGPIVTVSTEEPLGFDSIVEEALATTASVDVAPGPIELTASVSATYELTG